MEKLQIAIDRVRVPVKRVKTLDEAKVLTLAEDMLEEGQKVPISVRSDGDCYVLVEGLHRLEALRALGEDTVTAYLVRAKMH